MEIRKTEEDSRGCEYSGDFNGKNFVILSFKKGASRGGHYHNLDCIHFILYGVLEIRTIDSKGKEKIEIAKAGDVIKVKSGVIHLFIAKKESLILELRENNLETVKYRSYRKIVENFINKQNKE